MSLFNSLSVCQIRNRLKELFETNKQFLLNVSFLGLIQVFSIAFPFITYPYFISMVGVELYGTVIFYQAIIMYLALFVNFGFNVSAVKLISECYEDKGRISLIFCNVFGVKTILLLLSFLFLYAYIYFFKIEDNVDLIFYCSLALISDVFFPQWYFQAIEKLKIVTLLVFLSRVISLCMMFLFVTESDDYKLIPIISNLPYVFVGFFSLWIARLNGIKYTGFIFSEMFSLLKNSFDLFLTSSVIAVKNKFDIIFIGLFIDKEAVAIYDLVLKVFNIAIMPIGIFNNAIFAKMSKEKSLPLLRKLIFFSFAVSLLIVVVVFYISPFIISYMIDNVSIVIDMIRLLLISIPIFAISLPLAQNGLIVFNHTKVHLYGMLSTTFVYILAIFVVYLLDVMGDLWVYPIITILVYLYELLYRLLLCKKLKVI